MLAENNNASDYFIYYNRKEYPLGNKKKDIREDQRHLVGKSLDNKNVKNMLPRCTSQDELFASKLSFSLKEIQFSKQKFLASIPISNIKYNHPKSQNNNIFYLCNEQLDNTLAHYFADSETTKDNVDKFLSNLVMAPLIKKLFYQNTVKWMEKLLEIS